MHTQLRGGFFQNVKATNCEIICGKDLNQLKEAAQPCFPTLGQFSVKQEAEAKPSQQDGRGGSRASSQRSAQTVAAPAFTYEEAVAGFAAEEEREGADGADLGPGG